MRCPARGSANYVHTFSTILLGTALLVSWGCEHSNPATESAPTIKLDFHKPQDFSSAVARLEELHNQLISERELSEPISYAVVEITHRHGEGKSHVHYQLVDKSHNHDGHDHCHHDHHHDDGGHGHGGHRHDHGEDGHQHEDESESPIQHKIVVDGFTEIQDITRWLPGIASDSDMPEADWNQVKKISNTMIEDLTPLNQASTPDKQRQLYVSRSRELEDSIVSLKALKPVVDAELANETDN